MDQSQRDALIGQLDSIQFMLEGTYRQLEAMRRLVGMGSHPAQTPSHTTYPAQDKTQGLDYTTKEEDLKIDEMMGFDRKKDELLSDLTKQAQEGSADEYTRANNEQQQ